MSKLLAFDDIDEHKKEILWVSYNVVASTKDSVSVCVKETHVDVRRQFIHAIDLIYIAAYVMVAPVSFSFFLIFTFVFVIELSQNSRHHRDIFFFNKNQTKRYKKLTTRTFLLSISCHIVCNEFSRRFEKFGTLSKRNSFRQNKN